MAIRDEFLLHVGGVRILSLQLGNRCVLHSVRVTNGVSLQQLQRRLFMGRGRTKLDAPLLCYHHSHVFQHRDGLWSSRGRSQGHCRSALHRL
mmetsp:Transcript_8865/g.11870  ORF Transcript_8865/g.11870 Transcript_8865/m.11870 type:complete len:92 (-) Transcript_8865:675-950(-)